MKNINCFTYYLEDKMLFQGIQVIKHKLGFTIPGFSLTIPQNEVFFDILLTEDREPPSADFVTFPWIIKTSAGIYYLNRIGFEVKNRREKIFFGEEDYNYTEKLVKTAVLSKKITGQVFSVLSSSPLTVSDEILSISAEQEYCNSSEPRFYWQTILFLDEMQSFDMVCLFH